MRFGSLLAAAAALWVQPAYAVTNVTFAINVALPVTRTLSYGPNTSGWPARCTGLVVCSSDVFPDIVNISVTNIFGTSLDGINFTFNQMIGAREGISGSARYLGNGSYSGTSLSYFSDPGCTAQTSVCNTANGSTTFFSIRQTFPVPVPEPATWAMMLVGFGFVGAAMRRKQRHTTRVSYTFA